ncbi:MAG: ABC transporter permease [Ignavibacteriales bacterium]|nr:ABC transporter permease [Ignavibacteriales bacterium]
MSYEYFIARRYFSAKKKKHFSGIISLVSVIGITIGVAALVIILSVFNGFNGVVQKVLVGFSPHIRVEGKGKAGIENIEQVVNVLQQQNEIVSFAPYIAKKALLQSQEGNQVVMLKGVNENDIQNTLNIKQKIVLGKYSTKDSGAISEIVIGFNLADKLGVIVGNYISVFSPEEMGEMLRSLIPQAKRFRVAGIYETKNPEYDAQLAFISMDAAKEIFHTPNIQGIEIRLNDISQSEFVKQRLEQNFQSQTPNPQPLQIETWYDLHKDLFSVMNIERWSAYILLSCIIAVATFNLLGSLSMTVIEKRRDIGVLISMGAKRNSIQKIFLFEGMLVGVFGTVIGITLGLLVVILQDMFHLFPLDPTVYIIPAIPVEIRFADFFTVSFASLLLSAIASYIPSRRASAIIPMEAIRWE